MKRSLLSLALLAALPFSANAADINYNYVEADYASSHLSGTTADGYNFKGSAAFGDHWYGNFSYGQVNKSNIDTDLVVDSVPLNADFDLSNTIVSLGYHLPVSDNVDFFTELGYVRTALGIDISGYGDLSDSGNGYRVAGGVRAMLGDRFEGSFNLNYQDVGDAGDGVGAGVGGIFHVNDTWGITANYDYVPRNSIDFGTVEVDETINTWSVGVRASF